MPFLFSHLKRPLHVALLAAASGTSEVQPGLSTDGPKELRAACDGWLCGLGLLKSFRGAPPGSQVIVCHGSNLKT